MTWFFISEKAKSLRYIKSIEIWDLQKLDTFEMMGQIVKMSKEEREWKGHCGQMSNFGDGSKLKGYTLTRYILNQLGWPSALD